MDYEYRILLAEKELQHLREMQSIMRAHQDAHDQPIGTIDTILGRIEKNIEKLSAARIITEQKLQSLIDVLLREHSNGKPRN